MRAQTLTSWHIFNFVTQFAFDAIILQTLGTRALLYLLFSSFFAGSLHPLAGHFIAEHYLWDGLSQETYSYYGPLNVLAYNVCPIESPHSITYSPSHAYSWLLRRSATTTSTTTFPACLGRDFLRCVPSHRSTTRSSPRTRRGRWSSSTSFVTPK